MKIVFMGTPDFAVSALRRLAEKHEIVCVYTQAPKEAGRGKKLTKSPVQIFAEEKQLLVRTPKTLRSTEAQAEFAALKADVAVVAAYGLILPKPILEAFPMGCINIHASLLPRWRGAAPIQRAVEAGDSSAGITIMKMDEGLDTGDMLLKGEVEITKETTGGSLHNALAEIGAEETAMKAELDAGRFLICAMKKGDFTAAGHFIVVYGYDESGFLVNDPNCVARSRRTWPFGQLQGQIRAIWSLGI